MKRTVSQHGPRLSLLCVALLLCVGNAGSMDPEHLRQIVKYITGYGTNDIYAVAARLDDQYCRDPTTQNLQIALPASIMGDMQTAINKAGGLYVPDPIGNIVAAKPKGKGKKAKHAEWRLLYGDQNHPSPVARILENKDPNSCLIFFVNYSPCVGKCLDENFARSIVDLVKTSFEHIPQESKAFVFENVYTRGTDKNIDVTVLVDAWKRIQNVPLFRCRKNEACINCLENIPQNERNPCLDPPAPVPIG